MINQHAYFHGPLMRIETHIVGVSQVDHIIATDTS